MMSKQNISTNLIEKNADGQNTGPQQTLPSAESIPSSPGTRQHDAVSDSEIQRYKVRAGTTDQGREYEFKIAALLALRSVGLEVTNFWLATNADGAGAFDDLILHLEKPNGEEVAFMLQLKHKEDPTNITANEFSSTKGGFSLYKYYVDISNLHKSIHCDNAKKPKLVKDLGAFSNIYFMLYSNRGTYDHTFLEKHSNSPLSFLNTNSDGTVYKVDVTKVPDRKLSKEVDLDCNLFLLSNQVSVKHLDDVLVAEVTKISCMLKLSNLNVQDVAKGFVSYVTEWAKGNLGGNYYLTKNDVLCKLTELFLHQYTLDLTEKPFLNHEDDKLQIWGYIIANQPITVVDYSEASLKFLIQFVSSDVQKYCERPVKNWVEQFSQEEQQTLYNSHSQLKHIFKYVGIHGKIRPFDIYKSLWRTKQLPLLLKVSNLSNSQNISKIVKFSNYLYKVIVLHESLTLPCKEEQATQQHEDFNEQIIKSFKTLDDLDKIERNKVLEQEVKLQGRPCATLGDIVNDKAFQYITSRDILDILSGNFNIGNEIQEPVEYIIERTIFTKGVKIEILRICNNEIFLIVGKLEESLGVLPSLGKYKIFDVNDVDLNYSENIPHIINIHKPITSHQLEKLQKTEKPINILSVYDSNYLEWMWTYGSSKTIDKHEVQLKYEVNQKYIARFLSTAAIISDVPGMGKSVLTNYIAYHAPVDKWVIKVNLNAHQPYFRQRNTSSRDALAHLRYFYQTTCSKSVKNSKLSGLVFENFVNLKKIAILLDGFDELAGTYKDAVTNMGKSLYEEGFQVLITTRPVMKHHLEETFKTASVSLMPFTVEHQREYLTKYFIRVHRDLNVPIETKIQSFVEKLIQMASRNLNDLECEFMGIPLQTRLLANVFSSKCKDYIISSTDTTDFNDKYDILFLYEKFIENKINIFVEKYGDVAYEQHEEIRGHQALLAVKLIFPLERIIQVDTLEQVYQPLAAKPKLIQLLQREGIMIVDEKDNITCVHRTIAEFLAAQWLSDNLQNTNEEIKKFVHDLIIERFTWNYKFLFYIFDTILSQNCPLHLAIINRQINFALDSINSNSDIVNVVDKGGRLALHIAALNGLQYPIPYDCWYSEKDEMLVIAQKFLCGTIIMKTDVLGYTPLDYALASCSLQIANELCINVAHPFTSIYIDLQYQKDYLQYTKDELKNLLHILLPYFASRDLLQNNVKEDTKLATYYGYLVSEYKTIIQVLQAEYGKTYSGYVKKTSTSYYSDFCHAIVCGSKNNVKQLLKNEETKINKTDMDNNTPLHYAVLHGRSEIVKLLLEKDAKVNVQNKDLNTPLHLSLLNCNISISEMLLSKIVNLDSVNRNGETALHLAFSNNGNTTQNKNLFKRHSAIVQRISSKCRNIDSENNTGETPLHYSVKNGYSKDTINYLLLRKADVNKISHNEQTALHFALEKDYLEIAKFLVANGAHVNAADNYSNTPLMLGAERGNYEIVKFLVANGADVNAANKYSNTPLIYVAKKGNNDILKFLVANGADVNVTNNYSNTPLICVAKRDNDEILKFLVANGADVNVANNYSNTPLLCVAKRGNDEIVKFLVANGADVNVADNYGDTPLTLAAEGGNDESVKFLIANGADVNAADNYSNTPLIHVAKKGTDEIVKFVVANGADVNAANNYSNTPLIDATKWGNDEIVKVLVANGAKVNAADNYGDTPLALAAEGGNDEIVKFLVANGADVNTANKYNNTPLILATDKGNDEIVKVLVANGADVNTANKYNDTPLILATERGNVEIVKFLVANGADVNPEKYSNTPLILAAEKGNVEIVKFLVANGADVNAANKYNNTPLIFATEKGNDEIVKVLVANGADVNAANDYRSTPLILATERGNVEIVKFLVANGADINREKYSNTPLILATKKGNDEIIKFLVANGADVNATNYCNTLLILATEKGNDEIVKLLVGNGADVNSANDYRSTPLILATERGNVKIVKFLVANGADVNAANDYRNTPLILAVERRNDEIVKFLVANGADVNAANYVNTPLILATKRGNNLIVKFLVASGAKVNAANSYGDAPLTLATEGGNDEIVKFLVENGADVNAADNDSDIPLIHVA